MTLERLKEYEQIINLIQSKDLANIELGLQLAKGQGFCLNNYENVLRKITISQAYNFDSFLLLLLSVNLSKLFAVTDISNWQHHIPLIKNYYPNLIGIHYRGKTTLTICKDELKVFEKICNKNNLVPRILPF